MYATSKTQGFCLCVCSFLNQVLSTQLYSNTIPLALLEHIHAQKKSAILYSKLILENMNASRICILEAAMYTTYKTQVLNETAWRPLPLSLPFLQTGIQISYWSTTSIPGRILENGDTRIYKEPGFFDSLAEQNHLPTLNCLLTLRPSPEKEIYRYFILGSLVTAVEPELIPETELYFPTGPKRCS